MIPPALLDDKGAFGPAHIDFPGQDGAAFPFILGIVHLHSGPDQQDRLTDRPGHIWLQGDAIDPTFRNLFVYPLFPHFHCQFRLYRILVAAPGEIQTGRSGLIVEIDVGVDGRKAGVEQRP